MNPDKVIDIVRQMEHRGKEAVQRGQLASLNETIRRMAGIRQSLKASPSVLEAIDKAMASIRVNRSTVYDRMESLLAKRQR